METIDAIYQRRSIKQFDPDHRLTAEEETQLLEAAIQPPTSFNIQHWRFVILRDAELRRKIRTKFGNDQAQMTDASLLVLMAADVKAWAKGTLHLVGAAPKIEATVFPLLAARKSISASPLGSPSTTRTMLESSARHEIAPSIEVLPMSEINEAFRKFHDEKPAQRIVLQNDFD